MEGLQPCVVSPFPVFPLCEKFVVHANVNTDYTQEANPNMFELPHAGPDTIVNSRKKVNERILGSTVGDLSYLYNPYFPGSDLRGSKGVWNNDHYYCDPVRVNAMPPFCNAGPIMVQQKPVLVEKVSADLKNSLGHNSHRLW